MCQSLDATGAVVRQYYPEGELIAASNTAFYYGPDQLGTARNVYAASPLFQVAQAYDYDPYGNPIAAPATGPFPDFGYAGMYQHGPSGLSLTHYRAYHPASARWLARDPLGEGTDPALNLYRYVRGNPISLTDRQGLVPDPPRSFFFPPAPDPGAPPDPGAGAPPSIFAPPPAGASDDGSGGSGSPDCTNGGPAPAMGGSPDASFQLAQATFGHGILHGGDPGLNDAITRALPPTLPLGVFGKGVIFYPIGSRTNFTTTDWEMGSTSGLLGHCLNED